MFRNVGRNLLPNIIPLHFNSKWWDDEKLNIMKTSVHLKFTSLLHPELKEILLSTNNKWLREHTSRDKEWGDGISGGKNLLGQILMSVHNDLLGVEPFIIDIHHVSPAIINKSGSYVKLSDTLYFGIHPSRVKPDIDIDYYINLVEDHEFPDYKTNIPMYNFPIKDRKAPSFEYLNKIINFILTLSGVGYIFCKGGIGRSGTIAAALYGKLNNITGKKVLTHINKEWHSQRNLELLRPKIKKLGCPQTIKQKQIVIDYLG